MGFFSQRSRQRSVGGAAATLLLAAASAITADAAPPLAPLQHPAQAASAPYAGYYNHAHTTPAFRWGWFGAEPYCAPARWHRGYHGDLVRWTSRRGY